MRNTRARKCLAVFMAIVLAFTSNTASLEPLSAWASDASQQQAVVESGNAADAPGEAADATPAEGDASSGQGSENADDQGSADATPADPSEGTPSDATDADGADESSDATTSADQPQAAASDEAIQVVNDDTDPQVELVSVTATKDWVDNNDANRPDRNTAAGAASTADMMHLYFRTSDSASWVLLSELFLSSVGLDAMPTITVTNSGTNRSTYTATGLPATAQADGVTYNLQWKIDEQVNDAAQNAANLVKTSVGDSSYARSYNGSTLVNTLVDGIQFKVKDLDGGTLTAHEASSFTIWRQDGSNWVPVYATDADGNVTATPVTGQVAHVDGDDTNIFTLTFPNLPRYDANNNAITYSVTCDNAVPDTSDFTGYVEQADWFAPTYENAAVANHGTETDRAYEGGTVVLTRTNMTQMIISKEWLDNGNAYGTRPSEDGNRSYQLYLWRYVNDGNSNYQNAAQVLDANGYPVGADLPSDDSGTFQNALITFSYRYTDAGSHTTYLPKYDAEGYEYVYLARETKPAGDGYQQVFGSVAEDGTVSDTYPNGATRDSSDTGIYNLGTITNRLTENVSISGEKTWKAAAHQDYFSDYAVTMTLMQRVKAAEGQAENEWEATSVTQVLNGFSAELQKQTYAASMPRYDAQGRELEYEWVETSVTEGASTANLITHDDEQGTLTGTPGQTYFLTSHNVNDANSTIAEMRNRQNVDWYESVQSEDPDTGALVTTNTLKGKIDYKVTKKWYSTQTDANGNQIMAEPADGTALELTLYQNGQVYQTYSMTKAVDGTQVEGQWEHIFSDLPKYDENGNLYDYYAMETWPAGYFPVYAFDKDTRTLTIENHPGVGGASISVAKEWVDDSNLAGREPVVVQVTGVYQVTHTDADGTVHEMGSDFSTEATLSEANNWWQVVNVTDVDEASIEVTEVAILDGSTRCDVDYSGTAAAYAESAGETGFVQATVGGSAANGYQYVVQNNGFIGKVDGYNKYTVTNRRVGTVNIDVTKTWYDDGDEAGRPAAKLAIASDEGHTIAADDTGYYVQLTGSDVKRYIKNAEGAVVTDDDLVVKTADSSTYAFYGMPKFDLSGKIVHYTVTENWDASVTDANDYVINAYSGGYTVGDAFHTEDHQSVSVDNKRSASTAVQINKTWNDKYQYDQGNRPDISLTLWQSETAADGTVSYVKYNGSGFKNYQWGPRDGAAADRHAYELTADFGTLPKYDGSGHEIHYYIQETVPASAAADFDYTDTTYLDANGNAVKVSDGSDALVVSGDAVLLEAGEVGGTFVNGIKNTVVIEGLKVWQNLPSGYPVTLVPTVTMHVDQYLAGGTEAVGTDVAWTSELTVKNGTSVSFKMTHTGENDQAVASLSDALAQVNSLDRSGNASDEDNLLPKYDEHGALYEYHLRETYKETAGDWSQLFASTQTGYTMTNVYQAHNGAGSITVNKAWAGREGVSDHDNVYPAATFDLYRQYQLADGSWSKAAYVASKVLASYDGSTTAVTFDNLAVYAPDYTAYRYYVVERTILGQTTAFTDDVSGHSAYIDLSDEAAASVSAVAVSNTYSAGAFKVKALKKWNDSANAAGMRPASPRDLGIKVTRYANAQSAQHNAIASEVVYSSGDPSVGQASGVSLSWTDSANSSTDSAWAFEIDGLEQWAPNGSPWVYTIEEETVPDGYAQTGKITIAGNNGTIKNGVLDLTGGSTAITNSYDASATFAKTWVDADNVYGTRPAQLKLKLQVALLDSTDASLDAATFQDLDAAVSAGSIPQTLATMLKAKVYGSASADGFYLSGASASFTQLPAIVKVGTGAKYLAYQIAEATTIVDGVTYPVMKGASGDEACLNYTPQAGTTTRSGKVFASSATNTLLTADVAFTKTDATSGDALASAEFQLWFKALGADSYTQLQTLTSTDGSFSATGLRKGSYQLVETKVPTGYTAQALDGVTNVDGSPVVAVFDISVGQNGQTVDVNTGKVLAAGQSATIANDRILGTVTLTKVDAADATKTISGAKFKLETSADGGTTWTAFTDAKHASSEYTTGVDGTISIADLPWGTYRMGETSATDGYITGSTPYAKVFTVGPAGTETEQLNWAIGNVPNSTTDVSISKVAYSASGETPLAGAQFTLSGKFAGGQTSLTWASDGTAHRINGLLICGETYTLTEERVSGYYALPGSITFSVDVDGNVVMDQAGLPTYSVKGAEGVAAAAADGNNVTVCNVLIAADLSFTKTELYNETCADATLAGGLDAAATRALEGAQFTLNSAADANTTGVEYSQVVTSDAEGQVAFTDVPEGLYTLEETTVPSEHVKVADRVVQVNGEGQVLIGLDEASLATIADDEVIVNDVERADLSFTKVSDVDGSAIAGAVYELYRVADASDEPSTTGDNEGADEGTDEGSDEGTAGDLLVATATSDADGVVAFEGVLANSTYRIHEASAPAGSLRSSHDVTVAFEKQEDGSFVLVLVDAGAVGDNATAFIDENGNLIWEEPQTEYRFSKVDENGNALAGASLQVVDAQGAVMAQWVSDASDYELNGVLEAGQTYRLVETAAPAGYDVAEAIEFTVSDEAADPGRTHTVTVTMTDTRTPARASGGSAFAQTGDICGQLAGATVTFAALAAAVILMAHCALRRKHNEA